MEAESWILTEPYAGLKAQALGLAEAAGQSPTVIELHPRAPFSWVSASLWPYPLRAVGLTRPPDGLMFTAGGTGAAVGAALRTRGARVVQVQHPRMNLQKFDIVVANAHDRISARNVIITRNALHRARPEMLEAARIAWAPHFSHLPRPLVAVLVGGSNGRFTLGPAQADALARSIAGLMTRDHAGIVMTSSRRTSPEAHEAMRTRIESLGGWVWNGEGDNPYYGMLACADTIVVTVDSISMISEAVATRAPVLLAPLPGSSRRNKLFLKYLLDEGRVRHFTGRMDWWPVTPLDDTPAAGAEVRRRLGI
jgi:mitochondrial fission protein ELM1